MALSPLALLAKIPGALTILKEAARHLLRRPVVGVAAAARTPDGRHLLIQRWDTGTWALAGGTLEWGESLLVALERELEEEAGVVGMRNPRVAGVFSGNHRDPRFHAVTILVSCEVDAPVKAPVNPLEIKAVGLFAEEDVPRPLAMGMDDMLDAVRRGEVVLE